MSVNPCTAHVTSFDLSKAMTFSKVFNKVKLSPSSRLVLRCLVDFWNPKKGLVYPGQDIIAECTGASPRSVSNAIDELRKEGLILTTKKRNHLNYHFTQNFFELVGIADITSKNCNWEHAKIADTCHEQHEIKQNNNKILSFNFKTNFQKRYSDVFSTLSESCLQTYKALKGYEKEGWLKLKRRELTVQKNSDELKRRIGQNRQNANSPLDFSYEQAVNWLNNLPEFLQKSYFATELRKKWNL